MRLGERKRGAERGGASREGHREVATLYPPIDAFLTNATKSSRAFARSHRYRIRARAASTPSRAAIGAKPVGATMGFIAKLKGFDAHAKPQAHLTKKTAEGGLVSLVGFALMAVLFLSELFAYMVPKRVTTMGVDVTRDELLRISVDITYPGLPCQLLSLDALDVSGKHEADIGGELHKERVAPDGTSLGVYESHFEDPMLGFIEFFRPQKAGTPSPRLLHVEEIHAALKAKEGCRVHGNLKVQRTAATFTELHGQDWETLRLALRQGGAHQRQPRHQTPLVRRRLSRESGPSQRLRAHYRRQGEERHVQVFHADRPHAVHGEALPPRSTGFGPGAGVGPGAGSGGAGGSRGTRGKPAPQENSSRGDRHEPLLGD